MGLRDAIYNLRREQLHRDGYVGHEPTLEELEAEQRELERKDAYVVGLRRERMAVEAELARLRQLRPESRQWTPWEMQVGEPPTSAQRVAACEARIEGITTEIQRMAGDAPGLSE